MDGASFLAAFAVGFSEVDGVVTKGGQTVVRPQDEITIKFNAVVDSFPVRGEQKVKTAVFFSLRKLEIFEMLKELLLIRDDRFEGDGDPQPWRPRSRVFQAQDQQRGELWMGAPVPPRSAGCGPQVWGFHRLRNPLGWKQPSRHSPRRPLQDRRESPSPGNEGEGPGFGLFAQRRRGLIRENLP